MAKTGIVLYIIIMKIVSVVSSGTRDTLCTETDKLVPCTKINDVLCCLRKVGCGTRFDTSEDNPSAPTDLVAEVIENDSSLPRLNISWKAPTSGASLKHLTGFYAEVGTTATNCHVMRFNQRLNIHLFNSQHDNFFNFTSLPMEYQGNSVRVNLLSLPIPNVNISYDWEKVSLYANVTRKTEVLREINKSNSQKCEMNLRVKDNYFDSCNFVRLTRCKTAGCSILRRETISETSVNNSDQVVTLQVRKVPGKFYVTVIPRADNGRCTLFSAHKGPQTQTEHFEIRGNTTSCYIYDPNMQSTEGTSTSSPVISTSKTQPYSNTSMASGPSKENPNNKNLNGIYVAVVVIGCLVFTLLGGAMCFFLTKKKKVPTATLR